MITLQRSLFEQYKVQREWFDLVHGTFNYGIFYWNSKIEKSIWIDNHLKTWLGYNSDKSDSSVFDVNEIFKTNFLKTITDVNKETTYSVELKNQSKNEVSVTVQIEINIDLLNCKHVLGIVRSFSEINQNDIISNHDNHAQDELLRFKNLSENLPGFFYQLEVKTNGNFKFTFISEGIKQFGFTQQQVLTNPFDLLSLLKEEDLAQLIEMGNSGNEKHKELHKQFELNLKNGIEKRWIEIHDKSFLKENGDILFNGFVLDITDRINAEDELNKINRIFTHSIDMLYIAGFDGYFKLLNPAWSKTLGWSMEELLSKPWKEFVHPEDFQKTNLFYSQILKGKEALQFLNRYICKDGSLKWFSWNSFPYPKEGIMIGVARDVTNQIAKEVEYTTLFSEMLDGFALHEMIYDEDGNAIDYRFIDVNSAYETLTGLRASDIIGKTVLEVLPQTEKYWIESYENVVKTGESVQFENFANQLDKFFEVKAFSLAKDQFVTIFTDITFRKRAEKKLSESEEYHRSLFKAMPNMIFVLTKEGVYIDFKASSEQLYLQPEFFIGKNIKETMPLEIQEKFEDALKKALHKKDVIEFQYNLTISKKLRHYTAKLVAFGENKVIVLVSDVTESVLSKDALIKLNQELKDQTESLQKSNLELEQFAYVASHDLQEPLRMISSFLSLLEKKYRDTLDEKAQKYIQFSVNGALRMQKIITDLLEFSKVGRKPNLLQSIDLNDEVKNTLVIYNDIILQKNATIQVDHLPTIYTDKLSIQQIFLNLIGNALKFQGNNSNPIIHISCVEKSKDWEFSVKDNGIGIETAYFRKIFEMFQRLHTTDKFSGSGMGLSITKKIIVNNKGKIWLESELGKGSTFYFTIPKKRNDLKSSKEE